MRLVEIFKTLAENGCQCAYCSKEIPSGKLVCTHCETREKMQLPKDNTAELLHVFRYGGVVRNLIHRLKYGDAPRLSEFIAFRMAELYFKKGIVADIVCYVPVHRARLRLRGYDQCALIAARLSQLLSLPFLDALVRTKNTAPQFSLSKDERIANTKEAFALKPNTYFFGKTILLIDDLYTTGATMQECASYFEGAMLIPFTFAREY